MSDTELQQILSRLSKDSSDQAAWRDLFVRLWPFVLAIVWRRLPNKSLSEDAAQEVFVRLLRAAPFKDMTDERQLRAYVWRTAVNVSKDHRRRLHKLAGSEVPIGDNPAAEAIPDLNADVNRFLVSDALRMTQDSLEPSESALLEGLLLGRSIAETASELGQTYSNTAVQLHRLRRKLLDMLQAS
jgi:RNA polymerase sigma factor (sigma-70 family)